MTWLSSSRLLLALAWLIVGLACVAARLSDQEFEALSVVANTLGKRDWIGLNDNPCTNQPPWWINNTIDEPSGIYCNCTDDNTTCHVTHLYLKTMSLNGLLPRELVQLPFLEEIDLTRNYLNGSIPPQWGSMKSLRIISLLGNRLTGQIPKELANITTLEQLVLEANHINGTIPSELGKLTNIRRLVLSSNNLTGELPITLAQLTSLEDFRISGNNFSGSIPDYIQNWTNITRLEIQGSGLTGPIPSNLTSLTKLADLRISDLNGSRSNFPNLSVSTVLWQKLILRSCNLVGEIPPFIGNMIIEDDLDLSFNYLTGPIPTSLADLIEGNIYLTWNSLNGAVPEFKNKKKKVDLSYNNFTTEKSSDQYCGENPNLFANSKGSNPGTFYCVQSTNCKPDEYHSFYINCGGGEEGKYEADDQGSSEFYQRSNWGFKSTGTFMNPDEYGNSFTDSPSELNISGAYPNELYKNARLSPLSLTYYGFCLRNGNYTVNLHFAEIMLTNDTTYESHGMRIFDIYIQGILERKDYNIAKAAGGVLKAHTENFTADVSDHTLEIRFYWAGKGTTALPQRSVYGPLISAISVAHATYRPLSEGGLSGGAIAGIVMGVLSTVVLVLGILWWKGCIGRKYSMHNDLKGLDLRTGSFTLRQIKAATNNFDPANKIGEGGFGPVYKGVLLDGQVIAVKQLSSKSKQGNREFINEIGMISALQHPHLVKLYGCCIEGNQLLLVYEYCENNSLARALFGPEAYQLHLDWPTRHTICIGIARGLAYLHEESRLKIVHRDIKTTNVLLDENLVPKISDFGLAKLDEEENTHISTRIAGTFGYMAPEYAMHGYLTDKADVYSFGVVVLEIVSGKSNSSIRPKEQNFYLIDWANSLKAKGSLLELVDQRLELNFKKEEVTRAINVALLCTNAEAMERPSMSAVVSMLEGRVGVQKLASDSSISIDKMKPDEMEMRARDGEGQSISMDVPWSGSTASAPDLYPVAPDTSYWEKRGM